jgi:hypothetical protein
LPLFLLLAMSGILCAGGSARPLPGRSLPGAARGAGASGADRAARGGRSLWGKDGPCPGGRQGGVALGRAWEWAPCAVGLSSGARKLGRRGVACGRTNEPEGIDCLLI